MKDKPNKTLLSAGNYALRKRDYATAVDKYQKALQESPALSRIIKFNLKLAKSKQERPQLNGSPPHRNHTHFHDSAPSLKKFFRWNEENHKNLNPRPPITTDEVKLRNFGAAFIGPIFASFFSKLRKEIQKNSEIKELFFLSREGYFLELAFKRILKNPEEKRIKTKYLICSRTLLFKLILANPDQWENTLGHHYVGKMSDFLKNRYAFSESEIHEIKKHSKTYRDLNGIEINFETNKHLILSILQESREFILQTIKPKLSAYSRYLKEIGFGSTGEAHIIDIGFSGTIQKLLQKIQGSKVTGHYFLTTPKAENQSNLIFKGHIAENVPSGTEPLLDRSLYMESILTAPHGQTIDVGTEAGEVFFCFGKETAAQHNFNELRMIVEGAIEYASAAIKNGCIMEASEISKIYNAFASQKNNFPEITHKLFDIDDSISGFGIINPIKIF